MAVFTVRKGLDLKIAGSPEKTLSKAVSSRFVALKPAEFPGIKPKLLVGEGDAVKAGQPLFHDKNKPDVMFPSPAGGTVREIRRGARRVITDFIVEVDETESWVEHESWDETRLAQASGQEIIDRLLKGGMWPVFRQRPFGKIPDPHLPPRSIFINGMNTEPLAADPDLLMRDREKSFHFGIRVLKKLTQGRIYLCLKADGREQAFAGADGITVHRFKGPHPSGLVGTHIRFIEPLKSGERIWFLRTIDVADIGQFFQTGRFPVERIIALSGEGVKEPKHYRTRLGTRASDLTADRLENGSFRIISGTVLTGTEIQPDGFLGFYNTTCSVIPDSSRRDFMGWAMPGWKKFSTVNAYCSSLIPRKHFPFDTRLHGGVRAIVNIGAWEKVFPLDIHLYYLVRAVLAGDLQEAEALGLLEVTEEDVALSTFACPSKIELGAIIRNGLDLYEKESI
ncbi:Na(+)-translocating NADH-quinone reductase subunit A [bacterium]|nr:Na(+)-translocating NADH-quinone reductase subunit A [candidate division CSSED10-310 bacterium]